jgi:hypothetical protein
MNAAEYQRSDGMQMARHRSTLTGKLYSVGVSVMMCEAS